MIVDLQEIGGENERQSRATDHPHSECPTGYRTIQVTTSTYFSLLKELCKIFNLYHKISLSYKILHFIPDILLKFGNNFFSGQFLFTFIFSRLNLQSSSAHRQPSSAERLPWHRPEDGPVSSWGHYGADASVLEEHRGSPQGCWSRV